MAVFSPPHHAEQRLACGSAPLVGVGGGGRVSPPAARRAVPCSAVHPRVVAARPTSTGRVGLPQRCVSPPAHADVGADARAARRPASAALVARSERRARGAPRASLERRRPRTYTAADVYRKSTWCWAPRRSSRARTATTRRTTRPTASIMCGACMSRRRSRSRSPRSRPMARCHASSRTSRSTRTLASSPHARARTGARVRGSRSSRSWPSTSAPSCTPSTCLFPPGSGSTGTRMRTSHATRSCCASSSS